MISITLTNKKYKNTEAKDGGNCMQFIRTQRETYERELIWNINSNNADRCMKLLLNEFINYINNSENMEV